MPGSDRRMCSLQTSSFTKLHLCYSVPAPTCWRGSDLFICASSGCCCCISFSADSRLSVLEALIGLSLILTIKTQLCAYRIISSSCYVSPTAWSHSVQHCHIVITLSSVTSIPNVVFFHFLTPQFPRESPQWSAAHLNAVHFLARAVLRSIASCLSNNLCQCVNWSLTVWSSNLRRPEKSFPSGLFWK